MTTNLFDLTGKVAVITGAGKGIGRVLAQGLAEHGAYVIVVGKTQENIEETARLIEQAGGKASAVPCDVREHDQVARLFEQMDSMTERMDILINNAAAGSHVRPEDLPIGEWENVMQTNLTGYFLCAQQAGRRMIRQKKGSIINMSSIGGVNAVGRGNLAYDVSKAAVNQLTRDLAVEWAKHNIRVNAIVPCQILTPGLQALIDDPKFEGHALIQRFLVGIPMNRLGDTADLVGPTVFLASDASAFVTGVCLPVDGGNLALNAGGSHTW